MEFIEGKVIDPLEDVTAVEKVAGVLDHFATFGHAIPGSLCRGFCRGLLFPETEDLILTVLTRWRSGSCLIMRDNVTNSQPSDAPPNTIVHVNAINYNIIS